MFAYYLHSSKNESLNLQGRVLTEEDTPMRMMIKSFLSILFLLIWVSSVWATPVLYDWAFNVDGITYENFYGDTMPTTGGLNADGLGTLIWSTNTAGTHSFISFFDFDIYNPDSDFANKFDEYGAVSGDLAFEQSYEIDDPWYGFIYLDVLDGILFNDNYLNEFSPSDASMALGWDFSLDIGQTATITMSLTQTLDSYSGFYLSQIDAETQEAIYFFSTLDIQDGGVIPEPIPEPATMLLLSTGLAGLVSLRKRILE